jgi:integrase
MGTVFKKTFTKSLPAGAEIFTRKGEKLATWRDRKGRKRTAPVTNGRDGSNRIVVKAATYTAKYRNAVGHVVEIPTGCRDETAARSVLADFERRGELVKAGVMTIAEDAVADYGKIPLSDHYTSYCNHLISKGVTDDYRKAVLSYLRRLAADCCFSKLTDMDQAALETWLSNQVALGMSARSRNAYLAAANTFCNWCVDNRRLVVNPFEGTSKVNEKADPRRQRRALAEGELVKLLEVARQRPLLEAMTVRRGPLKGKVVAKLRDKTRKRLELLGWERALIYKTLVLTGLRKGELASLTVVQLDLDGPVAYVILEAADEKSRKGSEIPLRADLVTDIKQWLSYKLQIIQDKAKRLGKPIPVRLPADAPLYRVPAGLVRILDRDLKLAGIPKRDERGRTVDVHALRHSFGTLLSRGGVAPRTAQAAMRHSKIDLTMNVYTDPKLLDVAGAINSLPELPLHNRAQAESQRATGTDDGSRTLAPMLAPKTDNSSKFQSNPVISDQSKREDTSTIKESISADTDNSKRASSTPDNARKNWSLRESNPRPLACHASALPTELRPRIFHFRWITEAQHHLRNTVVSYNNPHFISRINFIKL